MKYKVKDSLLQPDSLSGLVGNGSKGSRDLEIYGLDTK